MKHFIKKILLTVLLIISQQSLIILNAQVGINSDSSNPDASAMLDVKSTDKGMLIPRMTTTQRDNIASPAIGLMIYNSTTNSFNYYNGTVWTDLAAGIGNQIVDADNDTKILVEPTADGDSIQFHLGGNHRLTIQHTPSGATIFNLPNNNQSTFFGQNAGQANITNGGTNMNGWNNTYFGYGVGRLNQTGDQNTYIGSLSGYADISGRNNVFIGHKTGFSSSAGTDNVFVGHHVGMSNVNGTFNTFIGKSAGEHNTSGNHNSFFGMNSGFNTTIGISNVFNGSFSGYNNINGNQNVYIGFQAGYSNNAGLGNTAIGYQAGFNNISGSGNLFLGQYAGYTELGSNKLYIENSITATPLIYGDFANDTVKIYGTLGVKDAFHFPIVDGTNGQALITNGNGQLAWKNAAIITDTDNDTKIEVEKTTNDNIIRFMTAGEEVLRIQKNSVGQMMMDMSLNNGNLFIGKDAGILNKVTNPIYANVFIGQEAGAANELGENNTFVGLKAGVTNFEGHQNVFMGFEAGRDNYDGGGNVFIGNQAGLVNARSHNVFIGSATGINNQGARNTFLGKSAGGNSASGNDNVFIGYQAGFNETGNHKLYIDNTNTASPLIYGDFANNIIQIHGTLGVKNVYNFPTVDGTSGQTLQTDGNGQLAWGNQTADVFQLNGNNLELSLSSDGVATHSVDLSSINATKTLIADADNNTKIQVEKNSNEDIVRMDLAGTERLTLKTSASGTTTLDFPNNNDNIAIGANAGILTTNSGNNNVFIGNQTGTNNTDGINNIFIGNQAGKSSTTAWNNIFLGGLAGQGTTTGNGNFFVGTFSGYSNTSGLLNIYLGERAGYSNTTGDFNVNIGYQAGENNLTGTANVFIGRDAGKNELGSNRLYIENTNTSVPLIYGEFDNDRVGINRVATTNTLEVGGEASKATAGSWLANSDARLKKNITPLSSEKMLNNLLALKGVTYEWNDTITGNNRPKEIQYGFTAQNIQEVFPTLVNEDNLGYLQTAYGTYDAMTVEAIRALNDKIGNLENLSQSLEDENQDLKNRLDKIEIPLQLNTTAKK